MPEVCVHPKADAAAFGWVLAFPPSAYAIRKIVAKTGSLLDKRANDISAALAIPDGHVVRTDDHFKANRQLLRKRARALLAARAPILVEVASRRRRFP